MESCDISVDTQSNFAYYEYFVSVLIMEQEANKKKLHKIPASLQPVFSCMIC